MTSGSDEHGNMTAAFEHFDLESEIAALLQRGSSKPGVSSKMLYKNADLRVVLLALRAGSRMEEHHADGTISVHVLRGAIQFTAMGKTHDLSAGHLFTLAASIPHAVSAVEDSVFLLTLSWPADLQLRALPHRGYGT